MAALTAAMNAFIVERARLLGVHRVGLRRLGLPSHIVGRGERGVLGLLGLRRGRRVRAFVPGEGLDIPGDLFERGILVWSNGFRRDRWLQQLVGRQWRSGDGGSTPPPVGAAGGAAPRGPPPPALARLAAALPSGLTFGTGLVGGTGFFGATEAGPKPVFVTASADGGGLGPSSSTGTPAALARLRPFSTVSIAGSSRRNSRKPASMSLTASAPGNFSLPAMSALTAALPAARCSPTNPAGATWRRAPPVLRLPSASASVTGLRRASRFGHGR